MTTKRTEEEAQRNRNAKGLPDHRLLQWHGSDAAPAGHGAPSHRQKEERVSPGPEAGLSGGRDPALGIVSPQYPVDALFFGARGRQAAIVPVILKGPAF